jgi:hypothetical protein
VATLAGVNGKVIEERMEYVMQFGLDHGRHQMVHVRDVSKEGTDKTIVTIFPPCRILKKGLFNGLSKDQALELLTLNSKMYFARFSILESKTEILVIASIDHLLETLDPDEFKASTLRVDRPRLCCRPVVPLWDRLGGSELEIRRRVR